MKSIPLTQGEFALVSDEDYATVVAAGKWFCWTSHGHKYAMRHIYLPDGKRTVLLMHRLITGLQHGDPHMVDHQNRNGLDNRRENLRVTLDQNPQNIGKRKDNSSGYKGVSFHKGSGKWQARIRLKGKSTCLGFFPSAESAALVYDAAALEYHKAFAATNQSLGLLAAKKPVVSVAANSGLVAA